MDSAKPLDIRDRIYKDPDRSTHGALAGVLQMVEKRKFPQKTEFAGVRIASASSIEISFYYEGKRCWENLKFAPTPRNIKRAASHRAAVMGAIEEGVFDYAKTFPNSRRAKTSKTTPASDLTVGWLLTDIYQPRIEKYLKSSTLNDYKKSIKNELLPAFEFHSLPDFTLADVKRWADTKTCGKKRILNILTPLRMALDEAKEDGLIEQNPLTGWNPKVKSNKPKNDDVDPFNADEQSAIIGELSGQAKNLIQFAFWSGLRTSEMIALDWDDIDLVTGQVIVNKAITTAASDVEDTKTIAGRRSVRLLEPARLALIAQKQHTFIAGKEVFQNPNTLKRWNGDQKIRETFWRPAVKRAKVRYRRPYQTRHTFASMMLSAGENIAWVAAQLGHSDLNMVARTYGKWIPDSDPEAGSKALKLFWNGGNSHHEKNTTLVK